MEVSDPAPADPTCLTPIRGATTTQTPNYCENPATLRDAPSCVARPQLASSTCWNAKSTEHRSEPPKAAVQGIARSYPHGRQFPQHNRLRPCLPVTHTVEIFRSNGLRSRSRCAGSQLRVVRDPDSSARAELGAISCGGDQVEELVSAARQKLSEVSERDVR